VGNYQKDVLATFTNIVAATNARVFDDQFGRELHSARALTALNYDALSNAYPNQLTSARKNAYLKPGTGITNLLSGTPAYDNRQCTSAQWPTILNGPGVSQRSLDTLRNTVFYGTLTPVVVPCTLAAKRGSGTQFPQLVQDATPTIP
jgi:hypothetical protein